ncbi:hypothetical protein [Muriicola soli]|nr:hypothetical protein [Muriicola soli]
MEQIYTRPATHCKLISTPKETVDFLLAYSKSLNIQKVKGMTIENNMN